MERKIWILIALTFSIIGGFFLSAFVAVAWETLAQITIECFSTKFWICYIPTAILLFVVFLFFIQKMFQKKTSLQSDIIDDIISTNNKY